MQSLNTNKLLKSNLFTNFINNVTHNPSPEVQKTWM